jgi:hypothetical protein
MARSFLATPFSGAHMRTRWTMSLSAAALAIVLGSSAAFAQAATKSVCKDGTKSAASGKGACSSHGGVDSAATAAAAKAAKSKGKAAAQVTCTDGTLSKGGQGACSGHGGIKKAADSTKAAAKKTPAPPAKKP